MVQVVFLVGALALVVATMLETQLLFAKTAVRRTAEAYISVASGVATATLLRQLAGEIAANGAGSSLTVQPLAPQCAATGACAFMIGATYAVTGSTTSGSGSDVAENVQTDALAQEARVSIAMTLSVTDAQGSPLASRSELLTVRTFDAPPYAAVSGVADAAAPTALVAEGDTAGCDPGTPSTCDPHASMSYLDTTEIFATRVCALESPGNGGTCPTYAPVAEGGFASPSWQNGNIAPPGWAR